MFRSSKSRTTRESRSVRLERLENREVFAGNVFVGVNPATQTIQLNGDNLSNAVEVQSIAGGLTRISGAAGTTINGAASIVVPFATPNLVSLLRGGNDRLFVHDIALNSLTVTDPTGNNTITTRQLQVFTDATITTDKGSDVVDFQARVQGDVAISTGFANDRVVVQAEVGVLISATSPAPLTPTLSIKTGDGNDNVRVTNSHVFPSGAMNVNTGAGDDNFSSVNNLIEGTLNLRMEDGRDRANIQTTDYAFGDYDMGAGNDTLELDVPSLVGSAHVFDGGLGFDTLDRNGVFFGAPSNFEVLI